MTVYEQLLEDVCNAQKQNRQHLSQTEQKIITLLLRCIKEAIQYDRFPICGKVRREVELVEIDFMYDRVFLWIHHKSSAKEIKSVKRTSGDKVNAEAIANVMQEIGLNRVKQGRIDPNPKVKFVYRSEEGTL